MLGFIYSNFDPSIDLVSLFKQQEEDESMDNFNTATNFSTGPVASLSRLFQTVRRETGKHFIKQDNRPIKSKHFIICEPLVIFYEKGNEQELIQNILSMIPAFNITSS